MPEPYCPASQNAHVSDAVAPKAAEDVPTGQLAQAMAEVVDWYCPEAQLVHGLRPSVEY